VSETSTSIVRSGPEPVPLALLGSTPAQVLDRATELADALAKVVRDRGLALRLDLWALAIEAWGSKVAVLRAYMKRSGESGGVTASHLTRADLRGVLEDAPEAVGGGS
jgi:hypothetical protein